MTYVAYLTCFSLSPPFLLPADKLCEKYPKPNGYYYECVVPGTSNTFSCRSSCGPPLEEVGKGLNLDLLQGGGLFGTFNTR